MFTLKKKCQKAWWQKKGKENEQILAGLSSFPFASKKSANQLQ